MTDFLNYLGRGFLEIDISSKLLPISLIVGLAILLRITGPVMIERSIRRAIKSRKHHRNVGEHQRHETILQILKSSYGVVLWIFAGIMILAVMEINVAPLLAGAGIAGVALGFGAQYLVRDLIAGMFVVSENQYRVGDVVCLDGTCGMVEHISLRMTILRDLDGTVHYIPNGVPSKSSNMSMSFSGVNIDIGIAYDSDLEQVIAVVNRVGIELAEDPEWEADIIEAPHFIRVDAFGDSAIIIKILGRTEPLKQWDVAGEFRKRLKIAFDQEGIVIPFPQRVIHQAK